MTVGAAPVSLERLKVATRPSAWGRRPRRKRQPNDDLQALDEQDSKPSSPIHTSTTLTCHVSFLNDRLQLPKPRLPKAS